MSFIFLDAKTHDFIDIVEGRNYTILKNFWRLVLADEDKIDYEKYFYNRSFGKLVTRRDVLNYILSLDKSFRASYKII
ncbi:hypothetical protein [Gemella morbillorum]